MFKQNVPHCCLAANIYKKNTKTYTCVVLFFMFSELSDYVSPVLSYPCIALPSVSSLILSVYIYI